LCRFIADEWPGVDVWSAFDAWRAARFAWVEANGSGSALGSALDLLRGHRDVRLRLPAQPQPAQYFRRDPDGAA
jgi:hypothetical protein